MQHVGVMAKICTPDAAARCKDIIAAADGIVLGRGTLGLELPPEKVFVAQKLCLSAANLAGKVWIRWCQTKQCVQLDLKQVAQVAA